MSLIEMRRTQELAAKLFRGLGDLSRLNVLSALRNGPLSVGDIVSRTGLTQPNASMHLRCLADCGLVTKERLGRFVHYEVADKRVLRLLDEAEELLLKVGSGIGACPRYRDSGGRPRRVERRSRQWRGR